MHALSLREPVVASGECIAALCAQLDDWIWAKGVRLQRRGGVTSLDSDGGSGWTAQVRELVRRFEVVAAFQRRDGPSPHVHVEARCACGSTGPCMHLAALAASVASRVPHTGPPRRGRFVWTMDDEALQLLCIEPADGGEPWRVPSIVRPSYVELATGRAGPIVTEVDRDLLWWLADIEPVDPLESWRMAAGLARSLRGTGVPLPRRFRIAPSRDVQPIPVLRLHARAGVEHDEPAATLLFDYDGECLTWDDGRREIVRLRGNLYERIARKGSEFFTRCRLMECGFIEDGAAMTMRDEDAWHAFVRDDVPALREAGWRVDFDDSFPWLVASVDEWYANAYEDERSRKDAWLLELGVVIEGERVDLLPAIVAAIRSGEVTRERLRVVDRPLLVPLPDGRRVEIDRARLQAMLDVLVELHDKARWGPGTIELDRLDLALVLELEGYAWNIAPQLRAFADRLRGGPTEPAVAPEGLCATLREYQLRGLAWLQWLREAGLGGVLADDMGLGKTIQALAHVLVEKQSGRMHAPVLVVAPRSVLRNWQREAQRFTPSLRTVIHHGPTRATDEAQLAAHDLVITTFGLLQRDELLLTLRWHLVFLDEAQAIKNPKTFVAFASRALRAEQRIAMTGTPIENNLRDLWSLVSFTNPGLLGTLKQFTASYRIPIEQHGDLRRFDALCRRVAPFMLRRTKAQVLTDLPPKTELVLRATLEGPQRDLYESVRMTMEGRVNMALDRRGLAATPLILLDALLKLRQVCCAPELVPLEHERPVPRSAKLDLLLSLLDDLVAAGRHILVFSQFTSMLDLIGPQLDARGIGWLEITGKTARRQEIVDRFQAGDVPVLLVSLKAGGTGLNLTRADTVIHYDPWWNPAVEAQATDRAHRIGQQHAVTVVRLICEGTVEERMLELQERKNGLLRGVQEGAERRVGVLGLDEGEIAELLGARG